MFSIKNLVFKKRPIYKLIEKYMEPYTTEEVVLSNVVKLQLLSLMRIYLVVNMSQIFWYKEQIKG